MQTITIRLPDDLKARIAAAAERAGKTSRAFILDAIVESVERDQLQSNFQGVAEARWARIIA